MKNVLIACEESQTVCKEFRKLGINLTCEPKYQTKKLYHA